MELSIDKITYDAKGIEKESTNYINNKIVIKRFKSFNAYAAEGNFST